MQRKRASPGFKHDQADILPTAGLSAQKSRIKNDHVIRQKHRISRFPSCLNTLPASLFMNPADGQHDESTDAQRRKQSRNRLPEVLHDVFYIPSDLQTAASPSLLHNHRLYMACPHCCCQCCYPPPQSPSKNPIADLAFYKDLRVLLFFIPVA